MNLRIDLCAATEVDALVEFLRLNWSSDHVLVRERSVLDWQHLDQETGAYNVMMAWDQDEVVGVLGFIPTSRYDVSLAQDGETVWLTTWRARDDRSTALGLALLRAVEQRLDPTWIGTVGLRPETEGIYRALRYHTGTLERLFLLDPERSVFHLAHGPDIEMPALRLTDTATLERLEGDEVLEVDLVGANADWSSAPQKTCRYVWARYVQHPFYDYQVHMTELPSDRGATLVVSRVCEHDGHRALRIVDVIGDVEHLTGTGAAFARLLKQADAEYLDAFVVSGGRELRHAGLSSIEDHPGLVLPGYFEPFEARNVALRWALRGPGDPGRFLLGKGDADQDRPSLISGLA